MKSIIASVIILFIINPVIAQKFTEFYGDYLGQPKPTGIPTVFAPGIISKSSLEHSSPVFSNDGNEIYWCSIELPASQNIKKIWFMKRINNRWTKPQALDLFDDSLTIHVDSPFLATDNKRLLISSARIKVDKQIFKPSQWPRYNNGDIWFVERTDNGWNTPKSISPVVNNSYLQCLPSLTTNGNLYFVTYLDGVKQECGIFRSEFRDGNYLQPQALPTFINSSAQDWTPFIAPDESYLIFSSTRDGSLDEFGDLYISYYDKENVKWSIPMNLGEPINSAAQERFPYVSPDGKYLFFTRWTVENNQDVFWCNADIIEKLAKQAVFEE